MSQAQERYGYLTPEDARAVGVDPTQLRIMASRGALDHIGHGLYRMPVVPRTSRDAYMEAVLWSGEGVLSHETALDLHELCDVNPNAIHLTVPKSFRTKKDVPDLYVLHRENLPREQVRRLDGLPVVSPERAIRGSIDGALGWELVEQAIDTARRRGAIDGRTASALARLRKTAAVR